MLIGTDVCVPVVFVCEETGVPAENPPVLLGYIESDEVYYVAL